MIFERTRDFELIKRIAITPHIYRQTSDDFSPSPEAWQPIENPQVEYVLAKDDEELLGMFALFPENAICWKLHPCLLRNAFGERSREIGKAFIQWVWANTPCLRLVAEIPEYSSVALKLAKDSGFEQFGINPASYMKDGRLHGQVMLGVSKWAS